MKKEAEMHAAEDQKKKELIDMRNTAETIIYTTEKMLKDMGDKIKSDDKKMIEEKIEALKKVKDGEDKEAIKRAADELAQAAQRVGAAMYQEQTKESRNEKTEEQKNKKDKTVEGEYEEVK